MEFDAVNVLLSAVIFFIYGAACMVSLMFIFSVEAYRELEEKLGLAVFSSSFVSPLDLPLKAIDDWFFAHNKIVGTFLVILSLLDLTLWFDVINNFEQLL